MSTPFSDITLYAPTSFSPGSFEYLEERALLNFVSDLYIIKMYSYKPPNTTRVCIDPSHYKIWNQTWTSGSLKSIAAEFIYDKYVTLHKKEKYQYVLEIIHDCMIQLSEEYNWDKKVFINAYKEVLENDFQFKIKYPAKKSKDRKKTASLFLEKTDLVTSLYLTIANGDSLQTVKIFDKRNSWWYDSVYKLIKTNKWFDNDKFGIHYKQKDLKIWFSIQEQRVVFEKNSIQYESMDLSKLFTL